MAFPSELHKTAFDDQRYVVHGDGVVIFVDHTTLYIIKESTVVLEQEYEAFPYAQADAERASQMLVLKELSLTETRRTIESADGRGKVDT